MPLTDSPHDIEKVHRLAARHAQRPTTVYHLHAIHRFPHVQTARLLQRPQVPPSDKPVLARAYPDDPALTFVPDERADRTLARRLPSIIPTEDKRLGIRPSEIEKSNLFLMTALRDGKRVVSVSSSARGESRLKGRTVKRYCGVTCGLSATVRTMCAC